MKHTLYHTLRLAPVFGVVVVLGLLSGTVGCKQQDSSGGGGGSSADTRAEIQRIDKRIAEIKSDPNIPAGAKGSMIAGMETAKRNMQAPSGPPPK